MDGAEQTSILKRDALSRVTTPRDRREALLDEFERSGLKGAQFARAADINYQTFAGWLQQRRHGRGDYGGKPQPSLRLVEAVVTGTGMAMGQPSSASATALEVLMPGGVRVLINNPGQAALAAQLIKAIAAPC